MRPSYGLAVITRDANHPSQVEKGYDRYPESCGGIPLPTLPADTHCLRLASSLVAFSRRSDGNMAFNHGQREEVLENRRRFLRRHGLRLSDLHVFDPSHSNNVLVYPRGPAAEEARLFRGQPPVEAELPSYLDGTDACLTLSRSKHIGLLSGDCVPLVAIGPGEGIYGIVHVGLLGLVNRVIPTLRQALAAYALEMSAFDFVLGPSISAEHYDLRLSGLWSRIGTESLARDPSLHSYIVEKDSRLLFDLSRLLVHQLIEAGALPDRIHRHSESTAAPDSLFFSNFAQRHQGGPRGRFLTIVGPSAGSI